MLSQGFEALEALVKLEVTTYRIGEPLPLRTLALFLGEADAIGKINTAESLWAGGGRGIGAHAFEERQGERCAHSMEESAAWEVAGFTAHYLLRNGSLATTM